MYGLTQDQFRRLPADLQRFLIEQNTRAAEAEHSDHRAYQTLMRGQAWAAAELVLKVLATLNGGAIVAMLALIGAMLSADKSTLPLNHVLSVLALFALGMLACLIAMVFAFFSTTAYIQAAKARAFESEPPYVQETDESKSQDARGDKLRVWGIVSALVSFAFAIGGAFAFALFAGAALS